MKGKKQKKKLRESRKGEEGRWLLFMSCAYEMK
jgi:hypothetical protein